MIRLLACVTFSVLIGCSSEGPEEAKVRTAAPALSQAVDATPALTATATIPATLSQKGAEIPSQFHGHWSSVPGGCDRAGDSILVIYSDHVDFYESRGKVLAVRVVEPRQIEVDLESTGEGETWNDTRVFELSEDGQAVTNVIPGNEIRRVSRSRCIVEERRGA